MDKEEGEDQREQQREFAQHGIRWRVEDAKAAGLHPLAAIGAAGASYSPVITGIGSSIGAAGQALGEGVAQATKPPPPPPEPEFEDPAIKRYNEARAKLAELEVVEKQYQLSQRATASQPGHGVPLVVPTSDENLVKGRVKPGVKVVPDEVTAGKAGLTAGTHQIGTQYERPGGGKIKLLSEKAAEATEDLDLLKYWMLWELNKDALMGGAWDLVSGLGKRKSGGVPLVGRPAKRGRNQ